MKSLRVYYPDGDSTLYRVGEKAHSNATTDFFETVRDICFMDYSGQVAGERTVADIHFDNAILTIVDMPCTYFRTLEMESEERKQDA